MDFVRERIFFYGEEREEEEDGYDLRNGDMIVIIGQNRVTRKRETGGGGK